MSKKRIKPADLAPAIEEILEKYGEEVGLVLSDAIDEVSADAVTELKSVNRFSPKGHPTGDYSADWDDMDSYYKTGRFEKKKIIFNRSHYQLTHLLEFGHALVRGGRKIKDVDGYPHIAEVNDRVQETLIRKVESRL